MISIESISSGLLNGEFFLEYLPIMSLTEGRCTGAEALIRWQRGGQTLQPNSFIPIAERTPLAGLITYWVMETVADQLGDWLRETPRANLSINIPPEIIGRGGIAYAASKSRLIDLAPQLIMEVTERGLPDSIGVETINASRKMGVRIAMDDFSLDGSANLAILSRANFDIIKLDRSLSAQIIEGNSHPEWLAGMSALLQSSQLIVIAEGVETELQHTVLRQAKIQGAQGYYYSKPIAFDEFTAFYARHQNG
jgi:sensor c-di-GMP phosphodiesterase-like protein